MRVPVAPCAVSSVVSVPGINSTLIDVNNYELKGGFFKDAQYGWMSRGPYFTIVEVETGRRIANHCFFSGTVDLHTEVMCVVELPNSESSRRLSCCAVGLRCDVSRDMLCLFDIALARVIRAIDMPNRVLSLCLVEEGEVRYPMSKMLWNMSGILAVGLQDGLVLLVDAAQQKLSSYWQPDYQYNIRGEQNPCTLKSVAANGELPELQWTKSSFGDEGSHLTYCLNANAFIAEEFLLLGPGGHTRKLLPKREVAVTALMYIRRCVSLVVGFSMSSFQIWNLSNLTLSYTSALMVDPLPVVHLGFQEPSDDPRNFCYLWAVHSSTAESSGTRGPLGYMYALFFKSKDWLDGYGYLYRDFQNCRLRLEYIMPTLDCGKSKVVASRCVSYQTLNSICQRNLSETDYDDSVSENDLCAFVWEVYGSEGETKATRLSLFDLNQWYKDQMPSSIEEEDNKLMPCYLVTFSLADIWKCKSPGPLLDVRIDPLKIQLFKSFQSHEEHFQPSALSFVSHSFLGEKVISVNHPGVQRFLLSKMDEEGPLILLDPKLLFKHCIRVGLRPLLSDLPVNHSTISETEMRYYLLSVALENGKQDFLRLCAEQWANGSHSKAGCTLHMLVEWGCQRAMALKMHVHSLCKSLFDHSGEQLDKNQRAIVDNCILQLHHLTTLFQNIIEHTHHYCTNEFLEDLESRTSALNLLDQYFVVLIWFLNVGLLPEFPEDSSTDTSKYHELGLQNITYPVSSLRKVYQQRRRELEELSSKNGRPLPLFIDVLLSHEPAEGVARVAEIWCSDGGDANYPPPSLQSLLQIYLVEGISTAVKHTIVIYVFLDIVSLLDPERYKETIDYVINFPSGMGMSASSIKIIQAFYMLDQKNFEEALDMILDPLVSPTEIQSWQHTYMVQVLMCQGEHTKALEYCERNLPDVKLKISLFVIIGQVTEAHRVQRQNRTDSNCLELLEHFFTVCEKEDKLGMVLNLQLLPFEEEVFMNYLETSKHPKANDMRVLYFLMRTRIVEAINMNNRINGNGRKCDSDMRNLLVDAYAKALPSVTQKLLQHCMQERKTLSKWKQVNCPTPLSVVVRPGAPQPASYKSSLYLATLEKARETWLVPIAPPCTPASKEKEGSAIQFMPFLCTPQDGIREDVLSMSILSSKRLQDEQGGTSRKKPCRERNVQPVSVEPKHPRLNIVTEMLHSPRIERLTPSKRKATANNSLTFTLTPHSILKGRDIRRSLSPENGLQTPSAATCETPPLPDEIEEEKTTSVRQIRFSLPARRSASSSPGDSFSQKSDSSSPVDSASKRSDSDSGSPDGSPSKLDDYHPLGNSPPKKSKPAPTVDLSSKPAPTVDLSSKPAPTVDLSSMASPPVPRRSYTPAAATALEKAKKLVYSESPQPSPRKSISTIDMSLKPSSISKTVFIESPRPSPRRSVAASETSLKHSSLSKSIFCESPRPSPRKSVTTSDMSVKHSSSVSHSLNNSLLDAVKNNASYSEVTTGSFTISTEVRISESGASSARLPTLSASNHEDAVSGQESLPTLVSADVSVHNSSRTYSRSSLMGGTPRQALRRSWIMRRTSEVKSPRSTEKVIKDGHDVSENFSTLTERNHEKLGTIESDLNMTIDQVTIELPIDSNENEEQEEDIPALEDSTQARTEEEEEDLSSSSLKAISSSRWESSGTSFRHEEIPETTEMDQKIDDNNSGDHIEDNTDSVANKAVDRELTGEKVSSEFSEKLDDTEKRKTTDDSRTSGIMSSERSWAVEGEKISSVNLETKETMEKQSSNSPFGKTEQIKGRRPISRLSSPRSSTSDDKLITTSQSFTPSSTKYFDSKMIAPTLSVSFDTFSKNASKEKTANFPALFNTSFNKGTGSVDARSQILSRENISCDIRKDNDLLDRNAEEISSTKLCQVSDRSVEKSITFDRSSVIKNEVNLSTPQKDETLVPDEEMKENTEEQDRSIVEIVSDDEFIPPPSGIRTAKKEAAEEVIILDSDTSRTTDDEQDVLEITPPLPDLVKNVGEAETDDWKLTTLVPVVFKEEPVSLSSLERSKNTDGFIVEKEAESFHTADESRESVEIIENHQEDISDHEVKMEQISEIGNREDLVHRVDAFEDHEPVEISSVAYLKDSSPTESGGVKETNLSTVLEIVNNESNIARTTMVVTNESIIIPHAGEFQEKSESEISSNKLGKGDESVNMDEHETSASCSNIRDENTEQSLSPIRIEEITEVPENATVVEGYPDSEVSDTINKSGAGECKSMIVNRIQGGLHLSNITDNSLGSFSSLTPDDLSASVEEVEMIQKIVRTKKANENKMPELEEVKTVQKVVTRRGSRQPSLDDNSDVKETRTIQKITKTKKKSHSVQGEPPRLSDVEYEETVGKAITRRKKARSVQSEPPPLADVEEIETMRKFVRTKKCSNQTEMHNIEEVETMEKIVKTKKRVNAQTANIETDSKESVENAEPSSSEIIVDDAMGNAENVQDSGIPRPSLEKAMESQPIELETDQVEDQTVPLAVEEKMLTESLPSDPETCKELDLPMETEAIEREMVTSCNETESLKKESEIVEKQPCENVNGNNGEVSPSVQKSKLPMEAKPADDTQIESPACKSHSSMIETYENESHRADSSKDKRRMSRRKSSSLLDGIELTPDRLRPRKSSSVQSEPPVLSDVEVSVRDSGRRKSKGKSSSIQSEPCDLSDVSSLNNTSLNESFQNKVKKRSSTTAKCARRKSYRLSVRENPPVHLSDVPEINESECSRSVDHDNEKDGIAGLGKKSVVTAGKDQTSHSPKYSSSLSSKSTVEIRIESDAEEDEKEKPDDDREMIHSPHSPASISSRSTVEFNASKVGNLNRKKGGSRRKLSTSETEKKQKKSGRKAESTDDIPSLTTEKAEADDTNIHEDRMAEYATTRRLTRHQRSLMSRSMNTPQIVRKPRHKSSDEDASTQEDDEESYDESEVSSIATRSSVRRLGRRKMSPSSGSQLSVLTEEQHSPISVDHTSPKSRSSQRSRRSARLGTPSPARSPARSEASVTSSVSHAPHSPESSQSGHSSRLRRRSFQKAQQALVSSPVVRKGQRHRDHSESESVGPESVDEDESTDTSVHRRRSRRLSSVLPALQEEKDESDIEADNTDSESVVSTASSRRTRAAVKHLLKTTKDKGMESFSFSSPLKVSKDVPEETGAATAFVFSPPETRLPGKTRSSHFSQPLSNLPAIAEESNSGGSKDSSKVNDSHHKKDQVSEVPSEEEPKQLRKKSINKTPPRRPRGAFLTPLPEGEKRLSKQRRSSVSTAHKVHTAFRSRTSFSLKKKT